MEFEYKRPTDLNPVEQTHLEQTFSYLGFDYSSDTRLEREWYKSFYDLGHNILLEVESELHKAASSDPNVKDHVNRERSLGIISKVWKKSLEKLGLSMADTRDAVSRIEEKIYKRTLPPVHENPSRQLMDLNFYDNVRSEIIKKYEQNPEDCRKWLEEKSAQDVRYLHSLADWPASPFSPRYISGLRKSFALKENEDLKNAYTDVTSRRDGIRQRAADINAAIVQMTAGMADVSDMPSVLEFQHSVFPLAGSPDEIARGQALRDNMMKRYLFVNARKKSHQKALEEKHQSL